MSERGATAVQHALLLTDIADGRALTAALGDTRMAAVWKAHDRMVRDLLELLGGREYDRTDGFLLLFDAVEHAVAYALAFHRAERALSARTGVTLRSRVGIHWGEVLLLQNSAADVTRGAKPVEVEGLAKPLAARVMSVAMGGQTLLSADARAAFGDSPLRTESRGHWRLKGVSAPVELFEVGDDAAPFRPPPDGAKAIRVVWQDQAWVPVAEVRRSLPAERDPFVGRDADLAGLARRLADGARLVSIVGMAGTGKTRLVTRFAWTWLGEWPGGTWFCDLSDARSPDDVCSALARALDVPLGQGDPVVQLGHAIAARGRCLVLLDNFEQVSRHAAETLGRWRERATEAAFVTTTREVLGLPGEETVRLAPLPLADGEALFLGRAMAANRTFAPTEDDRAAIGELVGLIDGLPLAIELAAARVSLMSPRRMVERMGDRFLLLASTGKRRDRQATLRAAMDWSWDLLSEDEQSALAQVTVFEGGFTLSAAEAVLALGETSPTDAVRSLVDKSLVRPLADGRFDLLATVQAYAARRLRERDGAIAVGARHGAYYAAWCTEETLDALRLGDGRKRLRELAGDQSNLQAACERAVARDDGEVAARSALIAWAILEQHGPFARGAALLEAALPVARSSPVVAARLRLEAGRAQALCGGGPAARAHLEAALDQARALGDRRLMGRVLDALGNFSRLQGRVDDAHAHLAASVVACRDAGDRVQQAVALGSLAVVHREQGRMDQARAYYLEALAVAREAGARREEARLFCSLGILCMVQGRLDEARDHYERGLHAARASGDRRQEGQVLGNLGILHWNEGRHEEARGQMEASLAICQEIGDRRIEGIMLGNLASLHATDGRVEEALLRYEAALVVSRDLGLRRHEGHTLGAIGGCHREAGRLVEARRHLDEGERLLRELDAGLELGGILCQRVALEVADGDGVAARAALEEAATWLARAGAGPDSELGRAVAVARATVASSPR